MLYGDFRIFQHYAKSSASNKSTLEMNSLEERKKAIQKRCRGIESKDKCSK